MQVVDFSRLGEIPGGIRVRFQWQGRLPGLITGLRLLSLGSGI